MPFEEGPPLEFLLHMREPLDDGLGVSDGDDFVPDPVSQFFRKAADDQIAEVPENWNWDAEIAAVPTEKRESGGDTGGDYLSAGERYALCKSIVRVDRVRDTAGKLWSKGYDANGELIDARIIVDAA